VSFAKKTVEHGIKAARIAEYDAFSSRYIGDDPLLKHAKPIANEVEKLRSPASDLNTHTVHVSLVHERVSVSGGQGRRRILRGRESTTLELGNAHATVAQGFPGTDDRVPRACKAVFLCTFPTNGTHGRPAATQAGLCEDGKATPSLRLVGIGLHDHVMSRVDGIRTLTLQARRVPGNTCFGV